MQRLYAFRGVVRLLQVSLVHARVRAAKGPSSSSVLPVDRFSAPRARKPVSSFPQIRPRRRRRTPALRRLSRETTLSPKHLIAPAFVIHGSAQSREIASMPGVFQLSVDERLDHEADRLEAL